MVFTYFQVYKRSYLFLCHLYVVEVLSKAQYSVGVCLGWAVTALIWHWSASVAAGVLCYLRVPCQGTLLGLHAVYWNFSAVSVYFSGFSCSLLEF